MRVPFVVAARQPLNLFVLAFAFVVGLTVALWLLPVGLVVYAALVGLSVRDTGLAIRMNQPAPVPRPHQTVFQAQIDGVVNTQGSIKQSVANAPPLLRQALGNVTGQVDGIVQQAFDLATKGQTLVDYLDTTNHVELDTQLIRTERQLQGATDPMLRQQYTETRDALRERIANLDALQTYRNRITAQLDNICANLENVLSETVRLRTAGIVPSNGAADDVSTRLGDLRADMDAFGKVLDTALTGVG